MSDAVPVGSLTSTPRLTNRPFWAAVVVGLLAIAGVGTWLVTTRGGLSDWPIAGSVQVERVTAPGFSVSRIPSGTLGLHDFAGNPVVLNLWASWCGPCRAVMPALDRAAVAHPELSIVGIAVEDVAAAAGSFADEVRVSYPLGIDDGQVLGAYPAVGLPTTWFIDERGTIVGQVLGEMDGPAIESYLREFFGT